MSDILLVDAAPFARRIACQILTGGGYNVDIAGDGQLALERAKERLPRLVITEILLPRLSGLELVTRLRAELPPFPILVLSTLDDEPRALAAGATRFMRKPIERARFLESIKTMLGDAKK